MDSSANGIARLNSEEVDVAATRLQTLTPITPAETMTITADVRGGPNLSRRSSFGKKLMGGHHPRKIWSGRMKVDPGEVGMITSLRRASSSSLNFLYSTGFTALSEDIVSDNRDLGDNENGIDLEVGQAKKSLMSELTLPIYLKFADVSYSVTTKGITASNRKEILKGITASAKPGELLALMGPSGCGKTTLLSLLGGRITGHIIKGSITYNDEPYTKSLKRRIGFVTQDDILYPHLTVKETLAYAALLRLPRTMSKQLKEERTMSVVSELGLERCQDTIIGGAFVRGVSGGERKRVCIGIEIIINPSLLFLDEPTSGLDSTTALRIIKVLQDIAKQFINHPADYFTDLIN